MRHISGCEEKEKLIYGRCNFERTKEKKTIDKHNKEWGRKRRKNSKRFKRSQLRQNKIKIQKKKKKKGSGFSEGRFVL